MQTPNVPGTEIGIDTYHETLVGSWHDVEKSGVKVSVNKLGEGAFLDPQFADSTKRSEAVGDITMAYWFARPDVATETQSGLIEAHKPKGMFLWLDLEESYADANDPTTERWAKLSLTQRQQILAALVEKYKTDDGEHPGLYVRPDFWESMFGSPSGYEKCWTWVPRYGSAEPKPLKNLPLFAGWQYSETGTVLGVDGAGTVDMTLWTEAFIATLK